MPPTPCSSWPKGQRPQDEAALLEGGAELSDRAERSLQRRASRIQFSGSSSYVDTPGGVKGESKPPANRDLKRKLSKPGLRMQEAPFGDDARIVRIAVNIQTISGLDPVASTYSATFTLHVAWEKTAERPGMPSVHVHNATAVERTDSAIETLPPSEDGSTATLCYATAFFRATLTSEIDLTWYPFDLQYLRIVVRVDEDCRLRPLTSRSESTPAFVERTATAGGTFRSLASFVSIDYPMQHAFARAATSAPQVSFTLRLQRQRSALTWACRLPLPLLAACSTLALTDAAEEAPGAARLEAALLLLLAMLGVRLGLSAPYGQNTTLIAPASAVDVCHLLGCGAFVGCVLLQAALVPWAALPPAARDAAVAANCAVWCLCHALAMWALMRRAPSIDEAAPSADAG